MHLFAKSTLFATCLVTAASAAGPTAPPAEASPPRADSATCEEQCVEANRSCPAQCGVSYEMCGELFQVCMQSCVDRVGPWLPC